MMMSGSKLAVPWKGGAWCGSATVIRAVPWALPAVAVIVAVPSAMPRTSPMASTTATAVSPDAHTNSVPVTTCPFASVAVAASRNVSPSRTVAVSGATVTALTSCATVTVALPEAGPAVAVIVAVPLATAVTSPDAPTVATAATLLAQVTVVPAIT